MSSQFSKNGNYKRNLQSITMFNYYTKILYPTLFNLSSIHQHPNTCVRLKTTDRKISHHYLYDQCEGVDNIDETIIMETAKATYFVENGVKIKENTLFRQVNLKLPYLPIYTSVFDQIDLVVLKQDFNSQQKSQEGIKVAQKTRGFKNSGLTLADEKLKYKQQKRKYQNYYLYVIHYSQKSEQGSRVAWENFIEKYHFSYREIANQLVPVIKYQIVCSFNAEACFFTINTANKFLQQYLDKYCSLAKGTNKLQKLMELQRHLILFKQNANKKNELIATGISFDPSHRRLLTIPHQHKELINKLIVQITAYYKKINLQRKHNPYFIENTVCRFASNNNFKQKQSQEALKYYFDFQKRMRDKYRIQSFQKFTKMKFFEYIGKDKFGRPILLNRARNMLCSQVDNFEFLLDYHLYLFEIFMQDQMEGYVDTFIVISDMSDQISDNTDIVFTKNFVLESIKISIGRHFKIICFHVGILPKSLYAIFKPLLPEAFQEKVKFFGDDLSQVMEELRKFISDDTIPEFIGGSKKTIDSMTVNEALENRDTKTNDVTTERSLIGNRSPRRF